MHTVTRQRSLFVRHFAPAHSVCSVNSCGLITGPSRNPMADRPQDFCGWLRAAVRSVQHSQSPFDALIIAARRAVVTGKSSEPFPC